MLKENGYTVEVAARNNLDVKPGLSLDIADKVYDVPFERSPFSSSNIKAYKCIKKILDENDYDVIHCNTPMGAVVTRLAAAKKRKSGTRVIYTAHGFHFYKGSPLKNKLFYFPVEWALSFFTDKLICINTEDYELAKKRFHAKETFYVKGVGFDNSRFVRTHTKEEAREALGIPKDSKVLFSIGELNKRKNHEVVIKALEKLADDNIYWYVSGNGPLEEYLLDEAKKHGLEGHFFLTGYTRELTKYFEAADLFVFPSLQEGLPVALMETMSFGLPVVASDIRGVRDLIKNGEGGFLLDRYDVDGFAEKIKFMLGNEDVCSKTVEHNREVIKDYEIPEVMKEMAKIYEL